MAQPQDILLRLKAMEKSFTFLLMEAATRLSELTESQMFIMIETPEGRTFTGSPSLCEKYTTHGLYGHLDDVMLRMDEPQPPQPKPKPDSAPTEAASPRRKRHSKSTPKEMKEPKVEISDIADVETDNDVFDSLPIEDDGLDDASQDDPSQWIPGRGSSKVWEYFDRHAANVDLAKCRLCNLIVRRTGGTTSPLRLHLKKVHGIEAEGIPNGNGAGMKRKKYFARNVSEPMRKTRKFVGDSEFQAETAEDRMEMVFVVKEEPSSTVNGSGGFDKEEDDSVIAMDSNNPSIDVTDISKIGTELNLLLQEKLTAVLESDPKLYFEPSTEEHKQMARCLYILGDYMSKQLSPHLGHTNPVVHSFFNRCWGQFADEYLTDFISRLPHNFGTIKTSNKMLTPRTYLRKLCNDNFRHKFRRLCIRETFSV